MFGQYQHIRYRQKNSISDIPSKKKGLNLRDPISKETLCLAVTTSGESQQVVTDETGIMLHEDPTDPPQSLPPLHNQHYALVSNSAAVYFSASLSADSFHVVLCWELPRVPADTPITISRAGEVPQSMFPSSNLPAFCCIFVWSRPLEPIQPEVGVYSQFRAGNITETRSTVRRRHFGELCKQTAGRRYDLNVSYARPCSARRDQTKWAKKVTG